MLISKDRAEHLAQLSYKYFRNNNTNINDIITYKKALELDAVTAEGLIKDLEEKISLMNMQQDLRNYNALSTYFGEEIIEINNYQYVDSYEYDYNQNQHPLNITVNMHMGENFNLFIDNGFGAIGSPNILTPNIYEYIFWRKNDKGVPEMRNTKELDLYLKLLILEDREINPYRIYSSIGTFTVLPMKERLEWIKDYQEEIDIVNKILFITKGYLIKEYASEPSFSMSIKPTVLYLEAIGEENLASQLRKHIDNELHINYMLKKVSDKAYGLVADNKKTETTLVLL